MPRPVGALQEQSTIPDLARVGMLEQQARDQGIDVDVRYSDTSGWYSNYRIGETGAAAKILIDRSSDRIVGAHLLGPEYGELTNVLALAIEARPDHPPTDGHDRCLPHGRLGPRLHALPPSYPRNRAARHGSVCC